MSETEVPNVRKYKRLLGVVTLLLVVSMVYSISVTFTQSLAPNGYSVQLKDKAHGGPDIVEFWLFKSHQLLPDPQLLASGRWVIQSWTTDGITYYGTSHNGKTNCYANALQYGMLPGAAGAKNATATGYIALSTNTTAPTTADQKTNCWMQGEITANGLLRQAGAVTYNSTALSAQVVNFKVAKTFTATGAQTNIYEAGLALVGVATCSATYPTNKCYIAITQLPTVPINMGIGDTLAVSWVSTFTLV
jgi:hypothetical protein